MDRLKHDLRMSVPLELYLGALNIDIFLMQRLQLRNAIAVNQMAWMYTLHFVPFSSTPIAKIARTLDHCASPRNG